MGLGLLPLAAAEGGRGEGGTTDGPGDVAAARTVGGGGDCSRGRGSPLLLRCAAECGGKLGEVAVEGLGLVLDLGRFPCRLVPFFAALWRVFHPGRDNWKVAMFGGGGWRRDAIVYRGTAWFSSPTRASIHGFS